MARTVETTIEINGIKIKQFSSLKLNQEIYAHHSFVLECAGEVLYKNIGAVFSESTGLLGAPVRIKVTSAPEPSTLSFSGIITRVEAACSNGYSENIVISGYSPTILMDQSPHCKSWMRHSIKSIVKDILTPFPGNWLKSKIEPVYKETMYYTVQYKQTAWQFMRWLAAQHGEWLYYTGQTLVLSAPKAPKVDLTYGLQLSKFVQKIEFKPGNIQGMAHDYLLNKVYDSVTENIAGNAGLNVVGANALLKSAEVLGAPSKCWNKHVVKSKEQLHERMSIQAAIQSSDVIRRSGCSDLPGLRPGDVISVNYPNIEKKVDEEGVDDYRIISIDHSWDGVGNYSNEFEAVPASVKVPPIDPVEKPYCETQSAVVVNNFDEMGLGRVQVRFIWMGVKEKSCLIRMVSPHAGNGTGLYMIPEIGDEVIVAFEGGNTNLPYVIGAVHHGEAKAGYANAGNDMKAIQTRSGAKTVINDKEGSLLMEDKNGNRIKMDGEGTITVKSNNKIDFECGDSKIEMNKNGTTKIRATKIELEATEEIILRSGKASFTANGQNNEASMEGVKSVISGKTEVKINASNNVDVQSGLITLN